MFFLFAQEGHAHGLFALQWRAGVDNALDVVMVVARLPDRLGRLARLLVGLFSFRGLLLGRFSRGLRLFFGLSLGGELAAQARF